MIGDAKLPDRFWSKVNYDPTAGCWLWTGAITNNGYAIFSFGKTTTRAHRLTYKTFRGPIAGGLDLDHLCRTRNCVNPEHLDPVTRQENIMRSPLRTRRRNLESCPSGHPYNEANMYRNQRAGTYQCRTCARERRKAK